MRNEHQQTREHGQKLQQVVNRDDGIKSYVARLKSLRKRLHWQMRLPSIDRSRRTNHGLPPRPHNVCLLLLLMLLLLHSTKNSRYMQRYPRLPLVLPTNTLHLQTNVCKTVSIPDKLTRQATPALEQGRFQDPPIFIVRSTDEAMKKEAAKEASERASCYIFPTFLPVPSAYRSSLAVA